MNKPLVGPFLTTLARPTSRLSYARGVLLAGGLTALVFLVAACGSGAAGGDPPAFDPVAMTVYASEAESAFGGGPFPMRGDARASNGSYLAPHDLVAEGSAPASVTFAVEQPGEHSLWARAFAPSEAGDAVYLGFGDRLDRTFVPETGRYVWFEVARQHLAAGPQRIQVAPAERGVRLDLVAVVRDPSVGGEELEVLVQRSADARGPGLPSDAEPFSLRGDPEFDAAALSPEQRVWFERSLVGSVASGLEMESRAGADDTYYYGRDMFQFSSAVLLALRSTGDLRFLDALDPMMEALRGQLYDGWCDGVDDSIYVNARYGTVVARDGFRNFRIRVDSSRDYCRDVADLDEALTHGHLAMVMYAYHVNRDLPSPAGVDYGERADFWFEYLQDDFEAKWRSRTQVEWPDMDFIDLKFAHTYNVFTLYYYFMGKRMESEGREGAAAYLERASSLTDAMFDQPYEPGRRAGGFVPVSVPSGAAVVYSFGSPGRGDLSASELLETSLEAAPTTYARYVMAAVLALRLEGFARWDDSIMHRLANGLTGLVIDIDRVTSSQDTIAASVTGEEMVGGMPPTTYRSRLTIGKFGVTSMPAFAVWDQSGIIEEISLQTYAATEMRADRPAEPAIPASMLFLETATVWGFGLNASR